MKSTTTSTDGKRSTKVPRRQLVQAAASKLRELILEREPGTQIGSLTEVAQWLGVGVVTVQQAARVLEHEGLLAVRRGPGGGYYGMRPDEAALERAFAAYLRVHGFGSFESLRIMSLLDCDIVPAAASCSDPAHREALCTMLRRLEQCDSIDLRIAFETDLRNLLLRMVAWPLVELLCRVTARMQTHPRTVLLFDNDDDIAAWKTGRRRILQAILSQDTELAQFEAERFRRLVVSKLPAGDGGHPGPVVGGSGVNQG